MEERCAEGPDHNSGREEVALALFEELERCRRLRLRLRGRLHRRQKENDEGEEEDDDLRSCAAVSLLKPDWVAAAVAAHGVNKALPNGAK